MKVESIDLIAGIYERYDKVMRRDEMRWGYEKVWGYEMVYGNLQSVWRFTTYAATKPNVDRRVWNKQEKKVKMGSQGNNSLTHGHELNDGAIK